MYNIVFSGRLLAGHSLPRVREAVARRLGLDLAQLQRLFSGKRMVIKHGVSAESAQHYLALLHELGMDARMEARDGAERLARFKVVYWGSVVEGFSRQMVMNEAARLFRLPPREILGLFSGRKAVLKRGLSAQEGARYVVRLAQIGMQIELEVDAESLPAAPVPTAPVRTTRSAPPRQRLFLNYCAPSMNCRSKVAVLKSLPRHRHRHRHRCCRCRRRDRRRIRWRTR